jgi:hypothetical protein
MKHMFYLKFKKMKRLFVFVPAIFLVLFLLNSFVLKEKEEKKKPIKEGKSSAIVNIIFKSADGGQTWQDISQGLPENCRKEVCGVVVSLQMNMGYIYVPEMGFITVNQIPQLLFGQKKFSLVTNVTLPLARMEYLHMISGGNF